MQNLYLEGVSFGFHDYDNRLVIHSDKLKMIGIDPKLIDFSNYRKFKYQDYKLTKDYLKSYLYKKLSKLLFTDKEGEKYYIIKDAKQVEVPGQSGIGGSENVAIHGVILEELDYFSTDLFKRDDPLTISKEAIAIAAYRDEMPLKGREGRRSIIIDDELYINDLDDENVLKFYETVGGPKSPDWIFYKELFEILLVVICTDNGDSKAAIQYVIDAIKNKLNQIYPYNY